MLYATQADIEHLRGPSFLATVVPDDVPVAIAAAAALDAASGRIDAYLSRRYSLPLVAVPSILRTSAVDLACYELACTHDRLTDDIEKRSARAEKLLRDISNGVAALGAAEPHVGAQDPAPGQAGVSSDDGASFSARPRMFGRGRPAP